MRRNNNNTLQEGELARKKGRDTHECLHTGVKAACSSFLNCDKQTPHRSTGRPSRDNLSFTRPSFKTRRLFTSIFPVYGTVCFSAAA